MVLYKNNLIVIENSKKTKMKETHCKARLTLIFSKLKITSKDIQVISYFEKHSTQVFTYLTIFKCNLSSLLSE